MRISIKALVKGEVASRAEATPLLKSPGDLVVVLRSRPRLLVAVCPDGCGSEVVVNLDRRAGPAWSLYRSERGVSIFPSIWRDDGCRSHFVIWNGQLFLFRDDYAWAPDEVDEHIRSAVEATLAGRDQHFTEIADRIGEVPWSVLAACESLVRAGRARRGKARGEYAGLSALSAPP